MPPYNPILIANYFVSKAEGEKGIPPLTPMKLVKLVYIAHGWTLALQDGRPLLSEQVEAWQYGPVLPSVYHAFKQYGRSRIEEMALPENNDFEIIEPATREILDAVWDAYKGYTASQLSTITHMQGTPWTNAMEKHKTFITNEAIKAHYDQLNNRRNDEHQDTSGAAATR